MTSDLRDGRADTIFSGVLHTCDDSFGLPHSFVELAESRTQSLLDCVGFGCDFSQWGHETPHAEISQSVRRKTQVAFSAVFGLVTVAAESFFLTRASFHPSGRGSRQQEGLRVIAVNGRHRDCTLA